MLDLTKYVVGSKLANTDDLVIETKAGEKCPENCVLLLLPESEWEKIKLGEVK